MFNYKISLISEKFFSRVSKTNLIEIEQETSFDSTATLYCIHQGKRDCVCVCSRVCIYMLLLCEYRRA